MLRRALLLVVLSTVTGVMRADQRVGNGGDPLELLFEGARRRAVEAVLGLELAHLPPDTPERAALWLSESMGNSRQRIRELAADIAASRHIWITDREVEYETCARTNVPAVPPEDHKLTDVFLSYDVCEERLDLAGTSLATELLIHEAMHHFGF